MVRFVSHADRLYDHIEASFRAAVYDVQREMMANAPVRTGDMRRRIRVEWLGRDRARVGLSHPGARMREFGGTIFPRRSAYLVFKTRDGQWRRAKQVTQRPGGYSQGFKPWIRPAGAKFRQFITQRLRTRYR